LIHDEPSAVRRSPPRKHAASPEIGAEKNPTVEEKEAMADFSQGHIEKGQDGHDEEKWGNFREP
jgi:hypothetical protein